jgi:hypothetical protein
MLPRNMKTDKQNRSRDALHPSFVHSKPPTASQEAFLPKREAERRSDRTL